MIRRLDRSPLQEHRAALAILPLFIKADEANTTAAIAALKDIGERHDTLSDLSATYLHLADISDRPHLLLESIEASSEALKIRPDDPNALYNWALGLSRLHLTTTAHDAWEAYLQSAPADGWAEEAQGFRAWTSSSTYQQRWRSEVEPALRQAARAGNVEGLQAIVTSNRQRSREWAERELLSEWATASSQTAEMALKTAELVGAALDKITGDRMLSESVAAITAANASGRGVARLRTGHHELAAGFNDLYGNWQLEQARHHFQRARDTLSESPFALWADFYLCLIEYYQGSYGRVVVSLEALQARFDHRLYPTLAGRVLWIKGLTAASTHSLENSAELYRRALEIFCTIGEEENLAAVQALHGEILSKLGRYDESWQQLYSALAKVDLIFDPIRHHAVLEVAILSARRQGLHRAGLAFANEHLHVARRTGSAQILHYAFMHRASLRYRLGDLQGTKADLAQAARAAEALKDPSLRQRSAADFELVTAEIQADTNPGGAISLLSRTIRQYERTHYDYLLPQAYGARAHAFLRLGELGQAEQDLIRQVQIYESSADEILQDVFRLSLLDQAAPTFDEMIELQATKLGRPVLALEYCERGRYRALLDAWTRASLELPGKMGPAPRTSFDPRDLQQRLPRDVAILEFALLDDYLLAWVITPADITMVMQEVRRPEIARQVRELGRGLAGESTPPVSHDLYDLLVRPIGKLLGAVSHLVVIPDKELFLIPFEVLVDRQTGRFLVEDRTVSYSPSASLHLHLREKLIRARKEPLEFVLAATGAQGGGDRYARLPGAVAEARSIAALYPRGRFLANPNKKLFLAALDEGQVLHFSGHAIPNSEQPFASKLVLADTPTEHVELYAYELYDRSLPHLKLVALSACGTAEPAKPALGTAATLAGPFLAAGVPHVIGSQWRVEDVRTRHFFAVFHRRFVAGADAATALRATKLELLQSSDPGLASPSVWGAFVLLGG